jgi:hypothetical protein
VLLSFALLPLVFAATASANAPLNFTQTLTVTTPSPNIACTPFVYSFNTLATFTVTRHYIQFYDGSTLVKEIRHIDFTGTLYRSDGSPSPFHVKPLGAEQPERDRPGERPRNAPRAVSRRLLGSIGFVPQAASDNHARAITVRSQ